MEFWAKHSDELMITVVTTIILGTLAFARELSLKVIKWGWRKLTEKKPKAPLIERKMEANGKEVEDTMPQQNGELRHNQSMGNRNGFNSGAISKDIPVTVAKPEDVISPEEAQSILAKVKPDLDQKPIVVDAPGIILSDYLGVSTVPNRPRHTDHEVYDAENAHQIAKEGEEKAIQAALKGMGIFKPEDVEKITGKKAFSPTSLEHALKQRNLRLAALEIERQIETGKPYSDIEFIEVMIDLNSRYQDRWYNHVRPMNNKESARSVILELVKELEAIQPRIVDLGSESRTSSVIAVLSTAQNCLKDMPAWNIGSGLAWYSHCEMTLNILKSQVQIWESRNKEVLSLPKRIKGDELAKYGFSIVGANQAKHHKHKTYRYHCFKCKEWTPTASVTKYGSKDGLEHSYCDKCYRENTRADYELV